MSVDLDFVIDVSLHLQRKREIVEILTRNGFGILVAASGLGKAWPSRRIVHALTPEGYRMDAALASPTIVRRTLEELGPTFIKLGRILSTRPGLVPPAFQAELPSFAPGEYRLLLWQGGSGCFRGFTDVVKQAVLAARARSRRQARSSGRVAQAWFRPRVTSRRGARALLLQLSTQSAASVYIRRCRALGRKLQTLRLRASITRETAAAPGLCSCP